MEQPSQAAPMQPPPYPFYPWPPQPWFPMYTFPHDLQHMPDGMHFPPPPIQPDVSMSHIPAPHPGPPPGPPPAPAPAPQGPPPPAPAPQQNGPPARPPHTSAPLHQPPTSGVARQASFANPEREKRISFNEHQQPPPPSSSSQPDQLKRSESFTAAGPRPNMGSWRDRPDSRRQSTAADKGGVPGPFVTRIGELQIEGAKLAEGVISVLGPTANTPPGGSRGTSSFMQSSKKFSGAETLYETIMGQPPRPPATVKDGVVENGNDPRAGWGTAKAPEQQHMTSDARSHSISREDGIFRSNRQPPVARKPSAGNLATSQRSRLDHYDQIMSQNQAAQQQPPPRSQPPSSSPGRRASAAPSPPVAQQNLPPITMPPIQPREPPPKTTKRLIIDPWNDQQYNQAESKNFLSAYGTVKTVTVEPGRCIVEFEGEGETERIERVLRDYSYKTSIEEVPTLATYTQPGPTDDEVQVYPYQNYPMYGMNGNGQEAKPTVHHERYQAQPPAF